MVGARGGGDDVMLAVRVTATVLIEVVAVMTRPGAGWCVHAHAQRHPTRDRRQSVSGSSGSACLSVETEYSTVHT